MPLPAKTIWVALARAVRPGHDALADFRERIAIHLSLIAAMVLAPFALNHLWAGRWALCALMTSTALLLSGTTLALRRGRRPPVPFWVLGVALGAAVIASILMQGVHGVPWAFPALFILFFVNERGIATVLAVALLVGASGATAVAVGVPVAARMVAAMGLTLVMINVVLNVIGELQGALVAQAITDPLTGAYNRRHLDTQLAQLPAPAAGAEAVNVLLAVDLDHFKAINDSLGHGAGDEVLQGVVALLNARKRPSDRLFRTGGEEFVLLLPRITLADAAALAEELRLRIEASPLLEGRRVTASIGVAGQRAGRDAADWLGAADAALYQAKRGGRNRVVSAG